MAGTGGVVTSARSGIRGPPWRPMMGSKTDRAGPDGFHDRYRAIGGHAESCASLLMAVDRDAVGPVVLVAAKFVYPPRRLSVPENRNPERPVSRPGRRRRQIRRPTEAARNLPGSRVTTRNNDNVARVLINRDVGLSASRRCCRKLARAWLSHRRHRLRPTTTKKPSDG